MEPGKVSRVGPDFPLGVLSDSYSEEDQISSSENYQPLSQQIEEVQPIIDLPSFQAARFKLEKRSNRSKIQQLILEPAVCKIICKEKSIELVYELNDDIQSLDVIAELS